MLFIPRRINAQVILLVSCILLVTGAISGWVTADRQSDTLLSTMRLNSEVMARSFAENAAHHLVQQDYAGLENFLLQSAELPDILRLQVCEPDGVVVGDVERPPGMQPRTIPGIKRITPLPASSMVNVEKGSLIIWEPIQGGNLLGWVRASFSMASITGAQQNIWKSSLLLSMLWVVCSAVMLLLVMRPFVHDIRRFAGFARNLDARKGAQLVVRRGTAELEELGASLNDTSSRLFNTEQELLHEREALQEQYSTLRGIIESADALIFSVDRQYRYTSFNSAHASVMQTIYGQEIRTGDRIPDLMTVPEDREKALRNLDRALSGERFVESAYSGDEARLRRFFEVSHNPIFSGGGAVIGVAVLSRDITERKLAEDELRRVNRELLAISKCNEVLMRATDERSLLTDICRIICDEAGYRMAWVGYAERNEAKTVLPMAWAGVEDGYLAQADITWADTERGRGPTGKAIRGGESFCIQDFSTDPDAAPWREIALQRGYRSSIALPLRDERSNSFGAIMIYSTEPYAFIPDEIRLLEALSRDLAFGIVVLRGRIERARAEQELHKLNEELELRVKDRTAELEEKNRELEKMNRLFVGRELRMKELKEKITELEKQTGAGSTQQMG